LVPSGNAADREHGRARLVSDRVPALSDVVEVDEGARRRVDLCTVDRERRVPRKDGVDLLVAELLLGVLLYDLVACVRGGVGVDAERGHTEGLPDRLPHERPEDGDSLDLVEPQDLHAAIIAESASATLPWRRRRRRA